MKKLQQKFKMFLWALRETLKGHRVIITKPFKSDFGLDYYFMDKDNSLYSTHPKSWATYGARIYRLKTLSNNMVIKARFRKLLKLSDNSVDWTGKLMNSLRDINGHKVSIRRDHLKLMLERNTRVLFSVNEKDLIVHKEIFKW